MKYAVGVDIGGTEIKAALVKGKQVIKRFSVDTEAGKGSKVVFSNIVKAIKGVWSKDTKGIGVGCAGFVDSSRGVVLDSPNLPFRNFNLKKKINAVFRVRVAVENDANCFALAAAKGRKNVIGLTLGTGIGSGIIINGMIYNGRRIAGEIGHLVINFKGPKCACGGRGCIESYIGGNSIKKRYGKSLEEFYQLALRGNKRGLQVFKEYGKYLGIGCINIMNSFDPEIIVVGGKASKAWRFFSKEMNKEIKTAIAKCPIVKSNLADAGIMGSVLLLKD
jgi:glucokinase